MDYLVELVGINELRLDDNFHTFYLVFKLYFSDRRNLVFQYHEQFYKFVSWLVQELRLILSSLDVL